MFFLPLFDDNPTLRKPFINWLLIAFMLGWYFLFQLQYPPQLAYVIGFIPARFFGEAILPLPPGFELFTPTVTLFSAMFSHGSVMHIAGNLWIAYLLGDNLEDKMGHFRFLVFVLICGVVGNLVHGLTNTTSPVPLVGYSGAVSGMITGYVLLFPRANFRCLIVVLVFFRLMNIPALAVFLIWTFGHISGLVSAPDGVAYFAHLGGAVAGALLVPFFKRRDVQLFAPQCSQSGIQTASKVSLSAMRRKSSVPSFQRHQKGPWG